MHNNALTLSAIAFVCLAAGCSTKVDVDDFDRTCEVASDCVAVVSGDVCGEVCPPCASSAIAASARAEHQAVAQRAATYCPPKLVQVDCALCEPPEVQCRDNVCEIADPFWNVDAPG